MLVSLNVKNFAIIDNMQIEFQDQMTCLTGETGAGKSLIIDAIGLLFGKRASVEMIRFGETKATIEGIFSVYTPQMADLIGNEFNSSDYLIIKREIYANGKSICKVNNQAISLNQLNEISESIGDIHTQYDTQGLFNPKNYLKFIDDSFSNSLLIEYQNNLKGYKQANSNYQNLIKRNADDSQKLEFLKFQIKELNSANLSILEEEQLKQQAHYLSHYEQISTNVNQVLSLFSKQKILENLYESVSTLSKVVKFDERYGTIQKKMEDDYYNLCDEVAEVSKLYKNFDFDLQELDQINERLGLYSDLKRKYKKTTQELVDYQLSLNEEINLIENFDDRLKEAKQQLDMAFHKTLEIALEISKHRKKLASLLQQAIIDNLADLQLPNTRFEIAFQNNNPTTFYNDGIDLVDFYISFNPGEPLKPLSKVASGGELSRFMLALKTIVSEKLDLQTIIFDEIDNGVSGSIAYSIANKIKSIANQSQVLCVTHLPQVAAIANHHLRISKVTDLGRTTTQLDSLTKESRIEEIAKMISNGNITTASVNLAKELLNSK
ncbi:MAG: DNA repair protein RecN [Bacilli bacterium]|jgi:DNA repair protein RecN (Recombination protein N)|nr:DNA repair protein RecN [Bacilli bacterium]